MSSSTENTIPVVERHDESENTTNDQIRQLNRPIPFNTLLSLTGCDRIYSRDLYSQVPVTLEFSSKTH